MSNLIILFGVLILVAGFLLMFRPALVLGVMESNGDKVWLYVAAVGVRILLGLVLIQQAVYSRYPGIIELIGWIALIAGFVLLVIGRNRFTRLVAAVVARFKPYARFGGMLALAFGALLVYAFV